MPRKSREPVVLPSPGEAFLMPLADGRLGVCRVLQASREQGEPSVLVASSPWIGSEPPALDEPLLRDILRLDHHSWKGNPEMVWVSDPVPPDFQKLGLIEPSPEESLLACYSYGVWEGLAMQVLRQWRWDNERQSVLREDEEERQAQVLARQAEGQKRQRYLAGITLERLLKKRRFPRWNEFVEDKPLRATRGIFRDTIKALIALGSEPRTRDALRILRACIMRLNELDEEHGFIMTIEREDLCEEFEEVVHAAGLGAYPNLADRWRDW